MYSPMTPIKAFVWTAAHVLAGSFVFWSGLSVLAKSAYRHWPVDLFYLCLLVPLSWFGYRSYRKGSDNSFFANIPKDQRRVSKTVYGVILICAATLEIMLAIRNVPDGRLIHFSIASVCLVVAADNWMRYLELKGPEVSSAH
jgi:hypothetical protein